MVAAAGFGQPMTIVMTSKKAGMKGMKGGEKMFVCLCLSLYVVSCAIDRVRGREEMHKE